MKNLHKRFAVIICTVFFIQCFNFSQVIPYNGTRVNAEGGTDGKVLPEQTGLASPAESDLALEFLGAEVSDVSAVYNNDGVFDRIIQPTYILNENEINDVTPPEVQFKTDVSPNINRWYKSDVKLSIIATDSGSGIARVRYSINGGNEQTYCFEPFIIESEGVNIVNATVVDKQNNSSKPLLQEIKIDKTAPEITIEEQPKGPISKGDKVKITFDATDKLSGVDYVEAFMNGVAVKSGDEILIDKPRGNVLDITACDKAGNICRMELIWLFPGYGVSGYISPGFAMDGTVSNNLKAGFTVEIAGTRRYAITDQNGFFKISDLPDLPEGINLVVSKRGYLSRVISVGYLDRDLVIDLVIGSASNPVDIWSGDVNGDRCINLKDIIELAKSFNKTIGNLGYDPAKDYNMDGSINMQDIMLAVRCFNTDIVSYPAIIK